MNDADTENIEDDADPYQIMFMTKVKFDEKDHLDEDYDVIMKTIMNVLMLIKILRNIGLIGQKP